MGEKVNEKPWILSSLMTAAIYGKRLTALLIYGNCNNRFAMG